MTRLLTPVFASVFTAVMLIVLLPLEAATLRLLRWGTFSQCFIHTIIANAISIPLTILVFTWYLDTSWLDLYLYLHWDMKSLALVAFLCATAVGGSVRHFAVKPTVWGWKNAWWFGAYALACVVGLAPRVLLLLAIAEVVRAWAWFFHI